MKAVVVGGGISGLAAAYRLRGAGCAVVVLEAEARPGGKIRTEHADGYTLEHGPNGFLDTRTPVLELARDVGLGARLLQADEAAKARFLFLRGRLRVLPHGPGDFLTSNILSPRGRARVLMEPLVPARKDDADESVYDFAARRIGDEAARTLVDAMVTGVYAGDAKRLSLPAAFPRMRELERRYGGLVKGMIKGRKERRGGGGPAGPGGRLTSFPDGLGELVSTVAASLGDVVQCGRPAARLVRVRHGWRVEAAGGEPIEADAVVLACPTSVQARLLGPLAPAAVAPLEAVRYAPVGVAAFGFRAADLPRPLDGFGYLVPSMERRQVLGVLWSSTIFRGRAPEGHALLRVIFGGAHRPDLLSLGDADLQATLLADVAEALGGPLPAPAFARIVRWPEGIPQYDLGHLDRVRAAEAAIAALDGIHLAGNGLYGVSLADCVARADALPGLVLRA